MGSIEDISQLCRLCLVKDDVNVPIFEETSDINETFVKINSCLPVKISPDDNLPKKICDGCSYKLDMLYNFRNNSATSEQQLVTWLEEAGLTVCNLPQSSVKATNQQSEILVKQEAFETTDPHLEDDAADIGVDAHSYILQQQKLPYQQEFTFVEAAASGSGLVTDEPPAKRIKRIVKKMQPTDEMKTALEIAKTEDDEDSELDQPDYLEGPSTSADDQPGPSGVDKGTIDGPSAENSSKGIRVLRRRTVIKEESDEDYKPAASTRVRRAPRVWTCMKCMTEFPTRKTLTAHRKTHKIDYEEPQTYKYDHRLEVYVCNACSAEFQDKEEVEKHITSHIETYCCKQCNEKFSNPYHFSCHMQQHTGDVFCCPLCSYTTHRRTCISTHINRMHYHKFYYYCKTCGKGFNDSVRFKEHENEHLGLKPFVCVVCNKSFVYSRYLLLHQIRYHTVGIKGQIMKNQCSICLKVFSRNDTLDRHMTARHGNSFGPREKRHLCDICGKGFATKDKMKIHYRVHTGIKPYTCQYCSKSFIKRDYLIMHERVHTGEKPYECQFCGKCFNQGAPLRIHIRGHTGERPYICQFCNTGFISKGSLNMHQRVCMGAA